ncbi:hypothetical protein [Bariatricus sp. HCP28S3_D3]|uniref:hypothetical protein n=1 Tax=Bariatricus sp. HCP28S3_D3 TaxID=3438901 RepID=UPI003F88B368
MGRAQELFNKACESYDHAQELVKTVAESYRSAERQATGSTSFNPGITMAEFDQILQGVLLTQALVDNDFDRLERQFIDKITDHGDLLDYIRHDSKGKLSLTWDEIAWMDSETQGELIKVLPAILESRCKDFLVPFVIVEKVVDENLMKVLVNDIVEIGACLAYVDGQLDEIEPEGLKAMLDTLLLKPWREMKKNCSA